MPGTRYRRHLRRPTTRSVAVQPRRYLSHEHPGRSEDRNHTWKGNALALLAGRVSLREPPSTCFAQGENIALIPIDRHTHERFKRDGIDTIFIRARARSLRPASHYRLPSGWRGKRKESDLH